MFKDAETVMASLAKAPAAYITIAALELPEMVDGVSVEAVPLAAAAAAEDLAAADGASDLASSPAITSSRSIDEWIQPQGEAPNSTPTPNT